MCLSIGSGRASECIIHSLIATPKKNKGLAIFCATSQATSPRQFASTLIATHGATMSAVSRFKGQSRGAGTANKVISELELQGFMGRNPYWPPLGSGGVHPVGRWPHPLPGFLRAQSFRKCVPLSLRALLPPHLLLSQQSEFNGDSTLCNNRR